ncbi:MAG TPA: M50 family metallopeptidase, partial [Roseomonas sp.]
MTSIVLLLIFPFFAISTVLFVHEMGHFIAARRTRTPIEQVAIGFGPELISWRDENETKWVIGLFPGTAWINLRENGDEKAAPCRELLARATTQIGGPLANVIFALMVLVSLPLAVGVPVSSTLVSGVVEGGPADLAGIQPGDRILSIDGHRVRSMSEIMELNRHRPGHTIKVRLSKGGLEQELMVTLRAQELGSGKAIGVMGFRSLPEVQRPSIG